MARTFGTGGEYIEIAPNAVLDDTSFSVAFRWRTSNVAQWEIVSKHQASTSQNGWGLQSNNASPNRLQASFKANAGPGAALVDASVNASDGNWHSAVARYVRSGGSPTLDLMVDGTSATQLAIGAFNPTTQVLRLGRSVDTFWSDFVGDIEDFAFWGARLTADEALAFCRGAAPGAIRPTALKLWLPLGDTDGS